MDAEPARVQDASGVWHAVDTTLIERESRLVPRWGLGEVSFSAGGDDLMASMAKDGRRFVWSWPTVLPTPVVSGDSARYPDALAGVVEGVRADLVVRASSSGFSHEVVVVERPMRSADGSVAGIEVPLTVTVLPTVGSSVETVGDPGWARPVEVADAAGTGVRVTEAGGIEFLDAAGEKVLGIPAPMMWDSSVNAGGDPKVAQVGVRLGATRKVETSLAALDLTSDAASREKAGSGSSADRGLVSRTQVVLVAGGEFLSDPATVFPVVILPRQS